MRRREFIAFVGGAALWPVTVHAQQRFKIGLLDTGIGTFFTMPFMSKLEELGFVEGKNLVVERRSAEGNNERLKEFAADLVRQRVDVIVTAGTPAGFAAERATSTIPIVLGANSDPVGVGLVASLARPGGNATGISLMAPEISAKRLDILSTSVPMTDLIDARQLMTHARVARRASSRERSSPSFPLWSRPFSEETWPAVKTRFPACFAGM